MYWLLVKRYFQTVKRICRLWPLGLLLLLPSTAGAADVLVITSKDTLLYHRLVDTLKDELPTHNSQLQLTVQFGTNNFDLNALPHQDLIVTVGSHAAHWLFAQPLIKTQVLNTFITRASYEALLGSHISADKADNVAHHSAIFLEQPYTRQLQFMQLIAPKTQKLSTLLGTNSQDEKQILETAAQAVGLQLDLDLLATNDNPVQKLKPLIANSDAFLVVPDQSVFNRNTAKWILMMSFRQKVPLFAYSQRYVEAGALAAIYSTPETIGKETALWLQRWAEDPLHHLPRASYPKLFETSVNHATARSLGITIPDIKAWEDEQAP